MESIKLLRFRLLGLLALLSACHQGSTTSEKPNVAGTVLTAANKPVAGAQVTVAGHVVATANDGTFSVQAVSDPNLWQALRVSMPGYPEAVRRIQIPNDGSTAKVQVRLTPYDQASTFALPTGNQNVTFNVAHGVAGAQLVIPGDSLVNPHGQVASGNANISLTFWSPDDDLDTAPAPLRASVAGDPRDDAPSWLLSYGMVDIDVRQNGDKLQVAPGKTLQLVMQTNAQRRDALANRPAGTPHGPTLWTLNPNTGVWDEDVGDSTYDVTTGQLNAVLRHLSTKNSDEPYTTSGPPTGDSSCITGRALGACGQPLHNAKIYLNVVLNRFGNATEANYQFTTDSNGYFRENFRPGGHNNYYFTATWNGHTTDVSQSSHDAQLIYVTDTRGTPGSPRVIFTPLTCSDKTGNCQNKACACFNDPSDPAGCMEALEAADPSVNGYNPCWANPLGTNFNGPCYDDTLTGSPTDTHYNTAWTYYATTNLCGNCWPLLDATFKDVAGDQSTGCTGNGAYNTGCCPAVPPSGSYDICADSGAANRRALGQPCRPGTDTCCPGPNDPKLQCSDFVCVPTKDPT